MQNNLICKKGRIKANAFKLVNFSAFLLVFIFLISFSSAGQFAHDSQDLQLELDESPAEIGVNFKTPYNFYTIDKVDQSEYFYNDGMRMDER